MFSSKMVTVTAVTVTIVGRMKMSLVPHALIARQLLGYRSLGCVVNLMVQKLWSPAFR
jgi:hypothetical protein